MSQENLELVQRAYAAVSKHDVLGDWSWFFEEFAHEELELRAGETYLDVASVYKGQSGWARFWRDFSSVWEEWHFDSDSFEFFDAGQRVVVFARAIGTGKGSGIEVTQDEAHVWTIRDGRMLLGISYLDRAEALAATGLSE
jgi:ketosteroid isomerase-like protein